MGRKSTTAEFIAKSKPIHKNSRLDYSEVNYQGNTVKVKIICLDHGPFMQTPKEHLKGSIGCKPCVTIKSKETIKKRNGERFIEKAKEKYTDCNFGFDLVEYEDSKAKVKIYCKKHDNIFDQTPSDFLAGCMGCKECSKEKRKQNSLLFDKVVDTTTFIAKASVIHEDEDLDYSLVDYKNKDTHVKIICSKHGLFEQSPNDHLQGKSCTECGVEKQGLSKRKTNEEFIKQANEKHDCYYTYPLTEYKTDKDKVIITCPIHGDFDQIPSSHLQGSGCESCGTINQGINSRNTHEYFIGQVYKIHKDRYIYDKTVYEKRFKKVIITCKIHGDFLQAPSQHLDGRGCQQCPLEGRFKMETLCREIFEKYYGKKFLNVRPNFLKNPLTGFNLELDGFNEELKVAFEYNGDQHYIKNRFNEDRDLDYIKWKDSLKVKRCEENNIKLIVIPYLVRENKLEEFILSEIKKKSEVKIN